MQSLILDTNVIISGLIGHSIPYNILELVLERRVKLFISQMILEEYIDVLSREKFSKCADFTANANIVLSTIEEIAIGFNPKDKVTILKDVEDNKFLELVQISNADFLITGNTNDFIIKVFGSTKIITPSEYWNTYKP